MFEAMGGSKLLLGDFFIFYLGLIPCLLRPLRQQEEKPAPVLASLKVPRKRPQPSIPREQHSVSVSQLKGGDRGRIHYSNTLAAQTGASRDRQG